MLYTVSADALQVFRLMLDTSAHQGVERGRAAVQGGHGGPQRRAGGGGGGGGLGGGAGNGALVAAVAPGGGGGEGRGARSPRPIRCPHQMPALMEVRVLEMRRYKPFWGPHRLALELASKGVTPTPSASAIYRCLLRAGGIQA